MAGMQKIGADVLINAQKEVASSSSSPAWKTRNGPFFPRGVGKNPRIVGNYSLFSIQNGFFLRKYTYVYDSNYERIADIVWIQFI